MFSTLWALVVMDVFCVHKAAAHLFLSECVSLRHNDQMLKQLDLLHSTAFPLSLRNFDRQDMSYVPVFT
jgi:hypothetical protein